MKLSTSHKIMVARSLSATVVFLRGLAGFPAELIAVRRGVTWSLDLKEGIDFSIWLLGGFEVRTLRRYAELVKPGDVVLDIGANVGAHVLPLAQLVGAQGKVVSFEPTAWAYAKQMANIALNPTLSSRIDARQMMLMASEADTMPEAVYSSWPLESAGDLHGEHHGRLMGTQGATRCTLDGFVAKSGIRKVDFVKLDVDGNEADVLQGAKELIRTCKPKIVLELAPYVYRDKPQRFDEILDFLWAAGYQLADLVSGSRLPTDPAGVRARIPEAGGLNVLGSVR